MTLTAQLTADGLRFIAHQDSNADADFDFSAEDLPAAAQSGSIVIEGVALILATDANAANRRVLLAHRGAGAEVRRWSAAAVQIALQTERYCFGEASGSLLVLDGNHQDPMPAMVCPDSSWFLRVSLQNGQAGDVISKWTVWGRVLPSPHNAFVASA